MEASVASDVELYAPTEKENSLIWPGGTDSVMLVGVTVGAAPELPGLSVQGDAAAAMNCPVTLPVFSRLMYSEPAAYTLWFIHNQLYISSSSPV